MRKIKKYENGKVVNLVMLRKNITLLCFVLSIITFCSIPRIVSANDYWICSDSKLEYYILGDSIKPNYSNNSCEVRILYRHISGQFKGEHRTTDVLFRPFGSSWMYREWNDSQSRTASYENYSKYAIDWLIKNGYLKHFEGEGDDSWI